MVGWIGLGLAGCNGEAAPPPIQGRVLAGPLIGSAVATSDPDGDGRAALWVSAPGVDGSGGVYRFDGPGGTLGAAAAAIVAGEPGAVGGAFAPCADLDGDGVEDLVLGAPARDDTGGVWWVNGPIGTTGLDGARLVSGTARDGQAGTTVACGDGWVAVGIPDTDGFDVVVRSGQIGLYQDTDGSVAKRANVDTTWVDSRLGFRTGLVVGADLNGDGVGDLAVGGSGAAHVHLVFGPFAGSYDTNTAGPTFSGERGEGTGHALAVGDLDGDGSPDLAIGAPFVGGDLGMVQVVTGPFDGTDVRLVNVATPVYGVEAGDQAGFSVAVPGDVDGDGASDLLVGAPFAGGVGPEAGAAYLVFGPGGITDLDAAAATLLGDVALGRLGWSVAGGDLDGDGVPDLVVGAPEADVGEDLGVGAVFTFSGATRGVVYPETALGNVDR